MSTMNALVRHDPESHRFDLYLNGEHAASLSYRWTLATRTLTHIEVDDGFEGTGVGSRLVAEALDMTRAEGLKVDPQCPFVRRFIEQNPEYLDLVPVELRTNRLIS